MGKRPAARVLLPCATPSTHAVSGCAIWDIPHPPGMCYLHQVPAQQSRLLWNSHVPGISTPPLIISVSFSAQKWVFVGYISEGQLQGDFYGLVTEAQTTFCINPTALPSAEQQLLRLQIPLLLALFSQGCHILNLPQIHVRQVKRKSALFSI